MCTEHPETRVYTLDPDDQGYGDGYRFAAHVAGDGGCSTSWHFTEKAASIELAARLEIIARAWDEKLAWHAAGDRTPDGGYVLRVDGEHFVASYLGVDPAVHEHHLFVGFGGRHFQWRDLETGVVRASNDVWKQGSIPDALRHQLPDNASWVEEAAA
ncbi:Uncharacterised protein (plasmid) [Tsukamurella tyrosinosolvens]|uniref:Uncharacterized protein n=1 Tax=Tsukamurella tyrosinosolvens TaxID=57704 RepID=A0A1H4UJU6_TSUTY|nr:hypothetical protein [Tsukamurella tyrosinosolvens]KXO92907.1 hypothetical protein AXK58_13615 [Tsukamurella tyrosinosolvens]SEC68551.1 hypothetical protein SAMN04489793_2915 [Tsukamurella tyrosinosolvens]VEH94253.1 Uncharacterised protein [Tsukamurella tyrosinosolvens]